MHGLTLVPNWVGAALQAIRNRLQIQYETSNRSDGSSRRWFQASGLKRTRLGYMVNAYPGYAFAGGAKPEAGIVIAFVDVGSRDVSFSIQIESGVEAKHRSNCAVEHRQDDATTAEDFVAAHASKILRSHNVNVAAEEGRLVFRVLSEGRLANDNIRITTPQLERGAAAVDRPPAHLQPASDRIDQRPPDHEPPVREKRQPEKADNKAAADQADETAAAPFVSSIPIRQDRGIDRFENDQALHDRGPEAGNHGSARWTTPDSANLDAKAAWKAAPFTIDFDQVLLRFPDGPSSQGVERNDDGVPDEPLEVEEYALTDGSVWSRNYLDVEEIEPEQEDGREEDVPPPTVSDLDDEMGLDGQRVPEFERPVYH